MSPYHIPYYVLKWTTLILITVKEGEVTTVVAVAAAARAFRLPLSSSYKANIT